MNLQQLDDAACWRLKTVSMQDTNIPYGGLLHDVYIYSSIGAMEVMTGLEELKNGHSNGERGYEHAAACGGAARRGTRGLQDMILRGV